MNSRNTHKRKALVLAALVAVTTAGCGLLGDADGDPATPAGAEHAQVDEPAPRLPGDPIEDYLVPPPYAPGYGTDVRTARDQLAALVIADDRPMTGYRREKFGDGWNSGPDGCDTRETVLVNQGRDVVRDPATCKVTAGTWHSRYDDVTVTDPRELDIDHVVPLAEAWRTGAADWTPELREHFANDHTIELVPATRKTNRAKGDQAPPEWLPPAAGNHCRYAINWIGVKSGYGLTASSGEVTALAAMLDTCRTA
ncbi:HNH endonuclease family protein [Saccharothrix sp. HUAS TT1]|uniref:HNH endonuclease family protein n=1 Tax=unclassified Saccharothrix TaxID=2593673 RepID=UPI00345C1858